MDTYQEVNTQKFSFAAACRVQHLASNEDPDMDANYPQSPVQFNFLYDVSFGVGNQGLSGFLRSFSQAKIGLTNALSLTKCLNTFKFDPSQGAVFAGSYSTIDPECTFIAEMLDADSFRNGAIATAIEKVIEHQIENSHNAMMRRLPGGLLRKAVRPQLKQPQLITCLVHDRMNRAQEVHAELKLLVELAKQHRNIHINIVNATGHNRKVAEKYLKDNYQPNLEMSFFAHPDMLPVDDELLSLALTRSAYQFCIQRKLKKEPNNE